MLTIRGLPGFAFHRAICETGLSREATNKN